MTFDLGVSVENSLIYYRVFLNPLAIFSKLLYQLVYWVLKSLMSSNFGVNDLLRGLKSILDLFLFGFAFLPITYCSLEMTGLVNGLSEWVDFHFEPKLTLSLTTYNQFLTLSFLASLPKVIGARMELGCSLTHLPVKMSLQWSCLILSMFWAA